MSHVPQNAIRAAIIKKKYEVEFDLNDSNFHKFCTRNDDEAADRILMMSRNIREL